MSDITMPPTEPGEVANSPTPRIRGRIESPKNLGERLIARRLALNLTQAEVACQVEFWNSDRGEMVRLSRSAYCMYESGSVVPDLAKLESIAKVLGCAPEWLAWGKGPNPDQIDMLVEVAFDAKAGKPRQVGEYWLDTRFCRTVLRQFRPSDLACVRGAAGSLGLGDGEIAIVAAAEAMTGEPAKYAYFMGDIAHVAMLSVADQPLTRLAHGEGGSVAVFDDSAAILIGRVVAVLGTS